MARSLLKVEEMEIRIQAVEKLRRRLEESEVLIKN